MFERTGGRAGGGRVSGGRASWGRASGGRTGGWGVAGGGRASGGRVSGLAYVYVNTKHPFHRACDRSVRSLLPAVIRLCSTLVAQLRRVYAAQPILSRQSGSRAWTQSKKQGEQKNCPVNRFRRFCLGCDYENRFKRFASSEFN